MSAPASDSVSGTDGASRPPAYLHLVKSPPHNLSPTRTPLVGRDAELAALQTYLAGGVRLLTLTGPGGAGKTRLARHLAHSLLAVPAPCVADGAFFVNLAPLTAPALVLATIAQTLSLRETADQPLRDTLIGFLRDKTLLLILDNWEHLLAEAPLAGDLLDACPHLTILATSREPLHLQGEQEFAVGPLGAPEKMDDERRKTAPSNLQALIASYPSVQLFVQRARAVKPDYALSQENAAVVAEICRRLDGLPLAIELAAARVKALPPQAILQRLDSRLRLLTGGARDLPARHQTLRNTLDWSYDLLTEAEKTLFRRLAVFMGGRTLAAVEAVCGEDEGPRTKDQEGQAGPGGLSSFILRREYILDLLTSLVDKSLLWTQEQADDETRYLMLVTIHEYAVEKLEESGEAEALRRRHSEYFLGLAEEAEPKLKGREQLVWLDRLERESDNIRAALHWFQNNHEAEAGLRLVGALEALWYRHSHIAEGRAWAEAMLELDQAHPSPGLAESLARVHARARALSSLGSVIYLQGFYQESKACHAASLPLYQAVGDRRGEAMAYNHLGVHAVHLGHYEEALPFLQAGLAISQGEQDWWATVALQGNMAYAATVQGDFQRAEAILTDNLAILQKVNDRWLRGHTLINLCEIRRAQGAYREAEDLARGGLALAHECQDKELLSFAIHNLAHIALQQARHVEASQNFLEGVTLGRSVGSQSMIAWSLAGLASVAEQVAPLDVAAQLVGAATHLLQSLHASLPFLEDTALNRTEAALRAQLGKVALATAQSLGAALSLEQTLDLARQVAEAAQQAADDGGRTTEDERQRTKDEGPRPEDQGRAALPTTPLQAAKAQYGGLTAREREVAALVAQGLTNDDIADQMSVVVKTVEKHMGNILGKLGFENRAQVAAWAVDRGLAPPPRDIETQWRKG